MQDRLVPTRIVPLALETTQDDFTDHEVASNFFTTSSASECRYDRASAPFRVFPFALAMESCLLN
jgi:hypothetical protein